MRVGLVSLQFEATATGGGGVHVNKVAENLTVLGHQVTVLSIHTNKTLGGAALGVGRRPFSVQRRDGLEVVRFLIEEKIDQPYVGEKEAELARIRDFCDAVAGWLSARQERFDVVHLHGHHLIPGYLAKELKGCDFGVVSTIHYLESTLEGLSHYRISSESLAQMKNWEAMGRFADALVVISPGMQRDFFRLLDELGIDPAPVEPKVHLVSSGIDEASLLPLKTIRDRLAARPEPVEVVAYARLDPSKGMEFAIQAAAEATAHTRCPFRLTVAGIPIPGYLDVLEREAALAHMRVPITIRTFEAIFKPAERDAFLDQFHIYLFPSLREPFGITLIEAGARGLIVVSTDAVGPHYILDDTDAREMPWGRLAACGILASRTDDPSAALAQNLGRALAWALEHWDQSAARALAFRARIQTRYTWSQVAHEYLAVYREVRSG